MASSSPSGVRRGRFTGDYDRLCVVQGCDVSNGSVKEGGLPYQFFSFPKEIRRREQWARAAKPNWPHWTPKPTDAICERHFTAAEALDCPSLMNGADPHLNLAGSLGAAALPFDEDSDRSHPVQMLTSSYADLSPLPMEREPSEENDSLPSNFQGRGIYLNCTSMPNFADDECCDSKHKQSRKSLNPKRFSQPSESAYSVSSSAAKMSKLEDFASSVESDHNSIRTVVPYTRLRSSPSDNGEEIIDESRYCCSSEIPEMRMRVHQMEQNVNTLFVLLRNLLHANNSAPRIPATTFDKRPSIAGSKFYRIGEAPREGNRALKRLYDADEVDEDNGPTQIKQEHIYNIADSEETATMASKTDSKRSELKKLTSTKPKQKQEWPCTYCEAIFDFRGYLSNHLKKHARDPPGGMQLMCDFCPMTLRSEAARQQHMRGVHGVAKLLCPQCGQSFERKKRLDKHLAGRHGIDIVNQQNDDDNEGDDDDEQPNETDTSLMGNIFGNCVVKEEIEEDDTANLQRKESESSQCGDPKVDMDTMTLRHPITGDELSESEIALHLARALLLLKTKTVTKQSFRMLGPDWIQIVDDADIIQSIDTLAEAGLLVAKECSEASASKKGAVYLKVLPDKVEEDALQDFGISLEAYAATL